MPRYSGERGRRRQCHAQPMRHVRDYRCAIYTKTGRRSVALPALYAYSHRRRSYGGGVASGNAAVVAPVLRAKRDNHISALRGGERKPRSYARLVMSNELRYW